MSTSCLIGMTQPDESIKYIRCNWDGMPDVTGEILLKHYSDPDKIRALLNLSDLSCLEKEVEPPAGCAHTFEHPAPDTTVAYVRDRGESEAINKARVSVVQTTYLRKAKREGASYAYLFKEKEGTWYVATPDGRMCDWKIKTPVAELLAR